MLFGFQEERWWWFWPEGKGREKSGFECILEIDLAHYGLDEYGEGADRLEFTAVQMFTE